MVISLLLPFLNLYIIDGYLESLDHLHNRCELFFIILIGLGNSSSNVFLTLAHRLEYIGFRIFAKYILLNIVPHPLHHILQGND
jgi:hypothetical protein